MININIRFAYDKDSLSFISSRKSPFEQIIINGVNQFFSENNELVLSEKISVLISVSSKEDVSQFQCENITADSFTILLNLKKLRDEGFDINKYIQYNVPLSKWFVFRKWYGKKSTFLDFIKHEIMHYIDRKMKDLAKYIKNQIASGKRGIGIELDYTIEQIRREAYPKLFDNNSDVVFSHTKLFKIKYAILMYIKSHGTELPSDFTERKGWFLGFIAPGDHHYYLAKYMAYIIAYNLMDSNTILNDRLGLKVKDINEIINKDITINQPSTDAKKNARKIILTSSPTEFLQLFEEACNKLKISQRNIPLNYSIFKNLETESFENQKIIENRRYQELVDMLKQGKITFFQLKKMVEERGQT